MGAEHTTRKQHEPQGPYAPPTPSEADQKGPKPMAVAADEDAKREAEKPTTQKGDQMDRGTAERYRDPNLGPLQHGDDAKGLGPASRKEEEPEGYEASDQTGYKEMKEE